MLRAPHGGAYTSTHCLAFTVNHTDEGADMANIIGAGAGPCGLATAALLARDGHTVTVLERDVQTRPSSAPEAGPAGV
jgi:NADPH-dependent 2,4-dienoyl-CoA reductase/sulfur reductase-like enzyme